MSRIASLSLIACLLGACTTFAPVGLVMRLFRDPLDRRMNEERQTNWIKRKLEPVDRARYEQQF